MSAKGEEAALAPLIGRAEEAALLEQAMDALGRASPQTSAPRAIHVIGEPGIGKSRLLAEARQRAMRSDYLVLGGRATEFERNYPFGVFVDALDRYLASLQRSWNGPIGEQRARELARIFPSLSVDTGEAPEVPSTERFHGHDAVRVLLEWLGAARPLVLMLDDLQWADAASVELLSHLLRRPPGAPVMLLLAYRPSSLPAQLSMVLEAARREADRWQALELTPLGPEESRELLGTELDRATGERLYRESGGNPFYLEQLARTEPRNGGISLAVLDAGDTVVPGAVAASIAGELATLSHDARSFLEAAAVVGEQFDPYTVATVVDLPVSKALEALDEINDMDLVRRADAARMFRFRHPLLRRAVYEATKPGWRIAAHARAAEALQEIGAPPVARADHVEQSASIGDEGAIAVLTEAAFAVAARAPGAAASWLAAALRLLPDDADAKQKLKLLVPLAVAFGAAGRLEDSSSTLREVLDLLPPHSSSLRARCAYFAASVELLLGHQQRGETLVKQTLDELSDPGSPDATRLKCGLALSSFFRADWDQMRGWSARALEEGRHLDSSTRAIGAAALSLAEYGLWHAQSAKAHADEAAALVDALPDEALASRSESILFLGWAEHALGRNHEVDRHMDRLISISRASGYGALTPSMLVVKSVGLTWRGLLDEAATEAEFAIEAALLSSTPLFRAWAFSSACRVETLRGNLKAAIRYGEEAGEAARAFVTPWSASAPWCLAEAWLELGEPRRCLESIPGAKDSPELPPFPIYVSRCYEVLARAEAELGDISAAQRWAQLAVSAGERIGVGGQIAEGLRARGVVSLAAGRFEEAITASLASAAAADQAGAPVEAARSRSLAGTALAASGHRVRALEELGAAESALARHGAMRLREQAAAEMRRLGRRISRPQTSSNGNGNGGLGLTPRQFEVAELVANGLTNNQIAAQLFLSEKGVESHLTRIFDRLDVSSRAALAATIERSKSVEAI